MLMFLVSNIVGSTIQITTLPLPVLSTLQASGLVFNTAFATLLLGESFTRFSLVGTILTCTGAALIAAFGAIGEPPHNLTQLLELLKERDFIMWMVATMLVVVATILFAHVLKIWSSHKRISESLPKSERPRSRSGSVSAGVPRTMSRSFTAQLPQPLRLRVNRLRLARGLSYALISGILSAHSLLVAKSAVELLVRTIVDHKNQFNRFQSWLILVALLFFALTQLYYLHLGLRLCSTSVLYPFVFCVYNIIAILDGLIYFQQGSRLSTRDAGLVTLGTAVLLSGVLALSWRLDDTTPEEAPHPSPAPPQSTLAPGMGLLRSPVDERTPLLPGPPSRSSSAASGDYAGEDRPLRVGKTRTPTLALHPPETDTEGIWAELDDDDARDDDYLASLPRTPSPFLTHNFKTRRRGDSGSSQAMTSGSRRSSDGVKDTQSDGGGSASLNGIHRRRSSAPLSRTAEKQTDESGSGQTHTRHRSTSVRFADHSDAPEDRTRQQPRRSRHDQSGDRDEGANESKGS
jgi:magnesium transporter